MNHNVETYDVETQTPLDILLGMVSKSLEETEIGCLLSLTIRTPISEACFIDALAAHSGQSRNKIAVQIIKTGLHALWQELPDDERRELELAAGKLVRERLRARQTESGEV